MCVCGVQREESAGEKVIYSHRLHPAARLLIMSQQSLIVDLYICTANASQYRRESWLAVCSWLRSYWSINLTSMPVLLADKNLITTPMQHGCLNYDTFAVRINYFKWT